jgi:raffinose/stachyose/melibiose transport system substrate-binding protein
MKKLLAIILVLTLVAALCPAAFAADDGIILFNGKIEIANALSHAAEVYEAATGKHVEINSLGGGVDLQSELKQRYQAGNMPDIFTCEGTPDFSNWTGMMVDMADQPWAADTEAEFIDSTGATVGFPYTTEAIGLAYNKSILDKAGIDPASITGPESMKAAFEKLDSMKDELGIKAVIGYCANSKELYWSTGNHLFCNYLDAGLARDDSTYFDLMMNEGKLDEQRFADFAAMVDLFNKYSDPALLVSGNYDLQVSGFAAGNYAFVTQGSWIGASLTDQYKELYAAAGNFECGMIPYAFEEGIDTILTNPPSHWAVYKEGKVDEALAFLQWLAGPDGQQIMVQEAGLNSPFKSCTVVANDPFAPTIADFTARGKTSSWHFLDQPANMAEDFTGGIFQDFAMGEIDINGFIEDMTVTIPDAVNQ